jgi:hypothetical protein
MGVNPAFLSIKAGARFGGVRKGNALYNRGKKDVHNLTHVPFHQKAIKGAVTRRFSRQGKYDNALFFGRRWKLGAASSEGTSGWIRKMRG